MKNINQTFIYSIRNAFFVLFFFCLGVPLSWGQVEKDPLSATQKAEIEQNNQIANSFKNKGNFNEATRYLNKIASVYWEHGYSEEAIQYFLESLRYNEQIGNENGVMMLHSNIGMLYSDMGKYEEALAYLQKTLRMRIDKGEKTGTSSAMMNIATVLINQKKYDEAIRYLNQSLEIAREINDKRQMRSCYGVLSEVYEKIGNAEKSIEFFKYYSTYEKHIQAEEQERNKRYVEEAQLRAELAEAQRKAHELELLKRTSQLKESEQTLLIFDSARQELEKMSIKNKHELEKNELMLREQEAIIRHEELLIKSFVAGLIFMVLFAFVIYRGYAQKKKVNIQLEKHNQEILQHREEIQQQSEELQKTLIELHDKNFKITSSINYAQRIQHAMLPAEKDFVKALPESFILFMPRDIVSGDFYWFKEIDYKPIFELRKVHDREEPQSVFVDFESTKVMVSAVDCTGHGVPGAFMSMIGYNLLSEIVSRGISEPNIILNELHRGVRLALKQNENDNKDGMDMALCVYCKEQKRLDFSGAKNSLFYIQNQQFFEIKGDKMPIGGSQGDAKRSFTKHSIEVKQPLYGYIFSDGYCDQFGGTDGHKFMTKRFKKLLVEIHQKPFIEQKRILKEAIVSWMGKEHKQIDDILVIGFRVG